MGEIKNGPVHGFVTTADVRGARFSGDEQRRLFRRAALMAFEG
jgi:hypothetical protein